MRSYRATKERRTRQRTRRSSERATRDTGKHYANYSTKQTNGQRRRKELLRHRHR
nr:MAG TPA: hypothetical protein [Caudoviricetes sp.]